MTNGWENQKIWKNIPIIVTEYSVTSESHPKISIRWFQLCFDAWKGFKLLAEILVTYCIFTEKLMSYPI